MGLNRYMQPFRLHDPTGVSRTFQVGVNTFTHKRHLAIIDAYIRQVERQQSVRTILDCPCGSGRIAANLRHFQLTCADRSDKRIEQTKAILGDDTIRYDVCDIFSLPYGDAQFDLVLCILLLQHIERHRTQSLLAELARVTRRWAIVTYSDRNRFMSRLRMLRDANRGKKMMDTHEFESFAKNAGFQILETCAASAISTTRFALLETKRHIN